MAGMVGWLAAWSGGMRLSVGEIGIGGDSWSGRVSGIFEDVLHRAALHSGRRAVRAVGVDLAFGESVVGGIAVDDHPGRAAKLGEVDLHSAEVVTVAHENDLALDVDVQVFELLEILRRAVVGVDHAGGEVAGG